MSKTKQELLEEYEKDYLARQENKKNQYAGSSGGSKIETTSSNLQNFVFQSSQENKKLEASNYIANCAACKKPVSKEDLKYVNGKEFHADCFEIHGNEFDPVDNDAHNKISKIRLELIKLKNLKSRLQGTKRKHSSSRTKKRKSKRKTKKKRSSRKKRRKTIRRKTKTRRRPRKRRVKKRTKRRTIRKKKTRRRTKRKASRRKVRRRSRKRKARRRR